MFFFFNVLLQQLKWEYIPVILLSLDMLTMGSHYTLTVVFN